MKVTKFGGTSLACSSQILKVKNIIEADEERKVVVASAPGKRFNKDIKITDLLLALNACKDDIQIKQDIINRFVELITDLKVDESLINEVEYYFNNIKEDVSMSEIVSRGEYFSSKILASYLGFKFIDSRDFMIFNDEDKIDFEMSKREFFKLYNYGDKIVVPGFYGRDYKGNIHLFSRGGSDITGAYLSAFLEVSLYENWTDVSGVFSVNPSLVKDAKTISHISYDEIRELSYMGANVLHTDSILPCQERNIKICILNTNAPHEGGTLISDVSNNKSLVTGIAGKSGFASLTMTRRNIQSDVKTLYKVLEVFDVFNVLIENIATGVDTLTITCLEQSLKVNIPEIIEALEVVSDSKIVIDNNISLVSIVSKNLEGKFDVISHIFEILKNNKIKTRLIDHSSDDKSIIIGVDDDNLDNTISSLYCGLNNMRLI